MREDVLARLGEAVDEAVDHLWVVVVQPGEGSGREHTAQTMVEVLGYSADAARRLAETAWEHGEAIVAAAGYVEARAAAAELRTHELRARLEPV